MKRVLLFCLLLMICLVPTVYAASTYSITDNLITVPSGANTLSSVYTDVNNVSAISLSSGVYTLHCNMTILWTEGGNTLNITDTSLNISSDYRIWSRGYLYIENSTISSTNTSLTARGRIMGRKLHGSGDGGFIIQIRNSTLSYLGPTGLDEWGEYRSGIFAYPPQTGEGDTDAPFTLINNDFMQAKITSGDHSQDDVIRDNTFHGFTDDYQTAVQIYEGIVDNNTMYDMTNLYGFWTYGDASFTNNTVYNYHTTSNGVIFRVKEGPGGYSFSNNLVRDSSGGTIFDDVASLRTKWSEVRDNVFYNFTGTGAGIRLTGNGYNVTPGEIDTIVKVVCQDNLIYNVSASDGGLFLSHSSNFGALGNNGSKHILWQNNTVHSSTKGIFVEGDKYENITFRNNNIYANDIDIYYSDGSSGHEAAGNTTAKFINTNYTTLSITSGTINFYSYLDVLVSNAVGLSGANISIVNNINSTMTSILISGTSETNFIADNSGHSFLPTEFNTSKSFALLEYMKTPSTEVNMTYNITGDHLDYAENTTVFIARDNLSYNSDTSTRQTIFTIELTGWVQDININYVGVLTTEYINGTRTFTAVEANAVSNIKFRGS